MLTSQNDKTGNKVAALLNVNFFLICVQLLMFEMVIFKSGLLEVNKTKTVKC